MSWIVRVSLFCVLLTVTIAAWGGHASLVSAQDQIYIDSMDSPDAGLLSTQSSNPDRFLIGYQDSQYVIQALEPSYNGDFYSFIGLPDSTNTRVEIDVAIAGDPRSKYALIGCRAGANDTGYMFEVHPENGSVALWRSNFDGTFTGLSSVEVSPAVLTGSASNHIAIDCQQNVITGSVNGQALVSATDDTYASGQSYIGAGAGGATVDGLLAGFDNLTITDRGGSTNVGPGLVTTANQDGMLPITDPRVDPQGALDDALWVTLAMDPAANQLAGSVDLGAEFRTMPANVALSDFYAVMYVTTPPQQPVGAWAVGFGFWSDAAGNFYDLYLRVENGVATWNLGQGTAGGGYQVLQSGPLPAGALDLTPGAVNNLAFMVYQGVAILSGATYGLDAVVTLPVAPTAGDVFVEVGFSPANPAETATLPMSVSDFSVWDLSSGLVPDIFDIPSGSVAPAAL
ncbi:MAG TPA: hypothetical protein VFP05_05965 [Thermomicrobiales bacterium]|nr:hypothetical protein [Thermomicrobiales bacterium]